MLYYCDDESLLWSDAFGMSRLASSRIKTLPQGSAHPMSTLSLDQHATTAMLYDAAREEASFYSIPDLERTKRLTNLRQCLELSYPTERTAIFLHPQGNALIVWQDAPYNDDGLMGLLAYNDETDQEAFYPLDFSSIPSAPDTSVPLHLGPTASPNIHQQAPLCPPFAIAHDGRFIAYSQRERLLLGGFWATAGAPPTLLWKLSLTVHPRSHAQIFTNTTGSLFALYDQSRYLLHLLHVDHYGTHKSRQLPARGLPAFCERTLAYQRDIETIVRVDLNTQEIEEFTLPAALVGDGRLFLGPNRLFFSPQHGESLYEIGPQKLRTRRLPETDKPLRDLFFSKIREYETIGRSARMVVSLDHFQRKERKDGPAVAYNLTAFGESDRLLSAFAFYHFQHNDLSALVHTHGVIVEEGGQQCYDSTPHSRLDALAQTFSLEEQHEVLRFAQRHAFDLIAFAPFLRDLHDARHGYTSIGAHISLHPSGLPLFSPHDLLAWFDLFHHIALSQTASQTAFERFASSIPLSFEQALPTFQEILDRAESSRLSATFGLLLRLAFSAWQADLSTLLIALLHSRHSALCATCLFDIAVMALRCSRLFPNTTQPLYKAFLQWLEHTSDTDARWNVEQVIQAPDILKKRLKLPKEPKNTTKAPSSKPTTKHPPKR